MSTATTKGFTEHSIATLRELHESLSDADASKAAIPLYQGLLPWYAVELSNMLEYSRGHSTIITLHPFVKSGSQWIANFTVTALDLPEGEPRYNWHGQNTDRWLYAGCILYDERDGEFSTHH